MSTDLDRLMDHYERLGGPELELFRSLYRCLALKERLCELPADPGQGASQPADAA